MHQRTTNIATPIEALTVTAICFGWFIYSALMSVSSPGQHGAFSDESLLNIVVLELILGGLALAFLKARGWSMHDLIPRPTALGSGIGTLLYVATIPVCWLAMAPFYEAHLLQPLRDLVPVQRPTLMVVIALAMVNGLYEEVFLLGYLLRGLRGYGLPSALGVSLLVRVLYHAYQGPAGMASVLAFGLVLGIFYVRSQALWPAVFAHTLADILPFV